mmetsp:Transcript_14532/g.25781  ORF Transcript_14532/g.25781 Transcript_14532/m.25781 type:complete len:92 (-) Transcript_14532:137-412(-)
MDTEKVIQVELWTQFNCDVVKLAPSLDRETGGDVSPPVPVAASGVHPQVLVCPARHPCPTAALSNGHLMNILHFHVLCITPFIEKGDWWFV